MPNLVPDVVPKGTMTATEQPSLHAGPALLLRPWQAGDIPAVVTAYADRDIQHWHLETKDEEEAAHWIERWKVRWQNETDASWAITDASSDTVLGRVGLREVHLDEGHGEMAYWVLPSARGRGTATSAVVAVTGWAFEQLGLHRVNLYHSVHNPASCRVATRTGFEVEGSLREFLLHDDGWHDYHLHAQIRA